jgi:uncharacterized protein YdeI (BOF family)
MKTKLIIALFLAFIGFTVNAQTKEVKPLMFNIEKTLVNIDKISSQDLDVQLKGTISEKIDEYNYSFKDESGTIKVNISPEQISEIGEYDNTTIFYIVGKIADTHKKTFKVNKITKP